MVRRCFPAPVTAACLVLLFAMPAAAQLPEARSAPAHISYIEGAVTLERDRRVEEAPRNMPILSGDRVRTHAGRAEILFADGSTLHLDRDTTLDLQSDDLVRLVEGRLRLSIPGPTRSVSYRIDAPYAWLQIAEPGEYRATFVRTSTRDELEAAVIRGSAELVNEDGRTPLRAGERAFARADSAPSYAYVFNSAAWDAFDRWSEERRNERLGVSTQYLPDEVQPYAGELDRYGSWRYESSYGYVWYPRVHVSWRPYYQGRWTTLPSYGWTWIGSDPWAWPTHHYGRWGIAAGAWFWIPGRSWAPAYVSWGYAPGYVSWCPLGWNNRPVFHINAGVNVYHGYDPWRAWTVVPQRHFGNAYVQRVYVDGNQIDSRTRGAFTYRDTAPQVGYAAPRRVAPITVAGTDPRRSTATVLTNRGDAGAGRLGLAPSSRSDARAVAGRSDTRSSSGRADARAVATPSDARAGVAPTGIGSQSGLARSRTLATGTPPDRPVAGNAASFAERATAARPVVHSDRAAPVGAQAEVIRQGQRYAPGASYQPVEPRVPQRTDPIGTQVPRAEQRPYERAPQNGSPDRAYGAYERRAPFADRPSAAGPSGMPSAVRASPSDRSAAPASAGPSSAGPSSAGPSSAGPAAAGPAAAGPQGGSRGRGEAPSRGMAVRRPGGGR